MGLNKTVIFFILWIALKTMQSMNTKQDRHVYVMSSDHGNSDGGGTGDIGSDEYSHYKALKYVLAHRFTFLATSRRHMRMAVSELEGYIPVIAKSIAPISNSRD